MFFNYFPIKFLKELAFCNLLIIALVLIYNLLVFLVPLVRIGWLATLLILLLTNLILMGLKFAHAQINQ